MGVLTNHIPLLTGLDTGLVNIRNDSSSNWMSLVVTGGFALVNDNNYGLRVLLLIFLQNVVYLILSYLF